MTSMATITSGHFDGEKNLNEPQRAGSEALLEELLAQAKADITVLEDSGSPAVAQLIFAGQPSATDTLVIGADTYEFDGAGSNINVVIAGSAELTIDNLVVAINSLGTEELLADKIGTTICRIRSAAAAGGAVTGADPDIALDASGQTNGSWDVGDVNMNTLAGAEAAAREESTAVLTITTAMITATKARVSFPFTPTALKSVVALSAGVPVTFTADTFEINDDDVLLTLGADLANGDVVTITAIS